MELNVIKSQREKEIMIQSIIANSEAPTAENVMKELVLMDDLLNLQRQRMLFMGKRTKSGKLRRDATLKDIIEKRIENHIKQL